MDTRTMAQAPANPGRVRAQIGGRGTRNRNSENAHVLTMHGAPIHLEMVAFGVPEMIHKAPTHARVHHTDSMAMLVQAIAGTGY
jgi:hypothetical protein